MKRKWWSTIPEISTKQTIISYINPLKNPRHMTLEIQDRLSRLMWCQPFPPDNWISNGNAYTNKKKLNVRTVTKFDRIIVLKMVKSISLTHIYWGTCKTYICLSGNLTSYLWTCIITCVYDMILISLELKYWTKITRIIVGVKHFLQYMYNVSKLRSGFY